MKHSVLEALPRTPSGTGGARKVRAEGYIPGILLGHKLPAVTLQVKSSDVFRVLKKSGPNALLDLSLEGEKTFAMIREFTRHPVSRAITHVDFMRVAADEPIEAPVPVVVTGEPAIEYSDYVVTLELNTVRVKSLPDALPQRIEVDAATLEPGSPVYASDLVMPEGVEMTEDPTMLIVLLAAPTLQVEETEETETEVAPAEPEAAAPAEE